MRHLLDTHTFLWFIQDDPRLSTRAKLLIEDGQHEKTVSAASYWEIAIKVGIGKLSLIEPFGILVPREIKANNFSILPISLAHAAIVSTLPHHHRDPFDRMLVAQAMAEGMPIVGADPAFDAYGVARFW